MDSRQQQAQPDQADHLEAAVSPLRDGASNNPDLEFVRAALDHRPAAPDLHTAVAEHHLVDAIYASAAADGQSVRL